MLSGFWLLSNILNYIADQCGYNMANPVFAARKMFHLGVEDYRSKGRTLNRLRRSIRIARKCR